MKLKISSTKSDVAKDFARYFALVCNSKPEVHIALSGGSTPKIVFDELAKNFQSDIDWSKIHLYWGDERCVPPDDDQSNFKMTKEHLLDKIEIPQFNVHRIRGENGPHYEAERYGEFLDNVLPKTDGKPSFDLIVLGLGDDGHTASIFPHEIELWDSEQYCEVAEHPESDQKRVTLTGQVINNAEIVVFLVTGENKAGRISEIIDGDATATNYPASLVAPVKGKTVWFLDEDAAKEIKTSQF